VSELMQNSGLSQDEAALLIRLHGSKAQAWLLADEEINRQAKPGETKAAGIARLTWQTEIISHSR
jgi:hypothetical protein